MAELGRFRSTNEQEYLKQRADSLNKYSSHFVADNPFLFTTRVGVTKLLTRLYLYEMIREIHGSIVECGVAEGDSLMLFAHLLSIFEPYSVCTRTLIGFDSFERGFVSTVPEDHVEEGELSTSRVTLEESIRLYDLNRPMDHFPRVELVDGDAMKTIPRYVEEHQELLISLLYLDFDIYKPTQVALECLLPRVIRGGVVAFDELSYSKFPGETKAFLSVLQPNSVKLRRFPYSPFVSFFEVE